MVTWGSCLGRSLSASAAPLLPNLRASQQRSHPPGERSGLPEGPLLPNLRASQQRSYHPGERSGFVLLKGMVTWGSCLGRSLPAQPSGVSAALLSSMRAFRICAPEGNGGGEGTFEEPSVAPGGCRPEILADALDRKHIPGARASAAPLLPNLRSTPSQLAGGIQTPQRLTSFGNYHFKKPHRFL